eukprot:scaffold9673_cov112-Isochrysis_galbana.AAC.5
MHAYAHPTDLSPILSARGERSCHISACFGSIAGLPVTSVCSATVSSPTAYESCPRGRHCSASPAPTPHTCPGGRAGLAASVHRAFRPAHPCRSLADGRWLKERLTPGTPFGQVPLAAGGRGKRTCSESAAGWRHRCLLEFVHADDVARHAQNGEATSAEHDAAWQRDKGHA